MTYREDAWLPSGSHALRGPSKSPHSLFLQGEGKLKLQENAGRAGTASQGEKLGACEEGVAGPSPALHPWNRTARPSAPGARLTRRTALSLPGTGCAAGLGAHAVRGGRFPGPGLPPIFSPVPGSVPAPVRPRRPAVRRRSAFRRREQASEGFPLTSLLGYQTNTRPRRPSSLYG